MKNITILMLVLGQLHIVPLYSMESMRAHQLLGLNPAELGMTPEGAKQTIDRAYRTKSTVYHPDSKSLQQDDGVRWEDIGEAKAELYRIYGIHKLHKDEKRLSEPMPVKHKFRPPKVPDDPMKETLLHSSSGIFIRQNEESTKIAAAKAPIYPRQTQGVVSTQQIASEGRPKEEKLPALHPLVMPARAHIPEVHRADEEPAKIAEISTPAEILNRGEFQHLSPERTSKEEKEVKEVKPMVLRLLSRSKDEDYGTSEEPEKNFEVDVLLEAGRGQRVRFERHLEESRIEGELKEKIPKVIPMLAGGDGSSHYEGSSPKIPPLVLAAKKMQPLLEEHGELKTAEVVVQENQLERKALFLKAIHNGEFGKIVALLQQDAHLIKLTDAIGNSVLMVAAWSKKFEVIEALLRLPCCNEELIAVVDNYGESLLTVLMNPVILDPKGISIIELIVGANLVPKKGLSALKQAFKYFKQAKQAEQLLYMKCIRLLLPSCSCDEFIDFIVSNVTDFSSEIEAQLKVRLKAESYPY